MRHRANQCIQCSFPMGTTGNGVPTLILTLGTPFPYLFERKWASHVLSKHYFKWHLCTHSCYVEVEIGINCINRPTSIGINNVIYYTIYPHSYTSTSVLENLEFDSFVRLQLHTVHNEFYCLFRAFNWDSIIRMALDIQMSTLGTNGYTCTTNQI